MTTTISPNGKWKNPSDEEIIHFLKSIKRIAIAGLSSNPARPSHDVARFLLSKGYEVIPVNPKETEVLGQKAVSNLRSIPGTTDLVDCFRRSEAIEPIAEEAIAIDARCLWMQLGVVNEKAKMRARAAGLAVVMDRCIKIEHAGLRG